MIDVKRQDGSGAGAPERAGNVPGGAAGGAAGGADSAPEPAVPARGVASLKAWGDALPEKAQDVLHFWFGAPDGSDYARMAKFWFTPTPLFDQMALHYEPLCQLARGNALEQWRTTTLGCLAMILLLDQLPRNVYRGSRSAFYGDAKALAIAHFLVTSARDRELDKVQRSFAYLPLMHSEKIEDQHHSVQLFESLDMPDAVIHAKEHFQVIKSFGRFPKRNAPLGRESTAEELAHMARNVDGPV